MPAFATYSDLFRVGRDEVLTRNAKISRDAVEREGMDANIMVASSAAIGDEVIGQLIDLAAALFITSATDDVLDRLVFDRYGIIRKPAAASVGSVSFTLPSNSSQSFPLPSGIVLATSTGQQFITTDNSVFPSSSEGPVVVTARSVLAGADQNAKAGTITSIVSPINGAQTGLTVNNALATVGGDDAESDPALQARAQKFFVTARRGTLSAIQNAAIGIPGIRSANAFEVLDALGRPARIVQLVVADAFTEQFVDYSVIPPQYQSLSQAITSQVQDALVEVRAAGMYVPVYVANVVLLSFQLALAFVAGADVTNTALAARAAVLNYCNALQPGTPFKVRDAQAQLRLVEGLSYTGQEIVVPAGDVVPKPLQVLRTSLALVSAVAAQGTLPIITGTNPDAYTLAGG